MNRRHKARRHYEDSVTFQKRFTTDVNCLWEAVISNPFILEKRTALNNHDKTKFNDSVFENVKIIETEGKINSFISGGKDWSLSWLSC